MKLSKGEHTIIIDILFMKTSKKAYVDSSVDF